MPNYRTQDPYERIPINQLARINQNDPWFGLGYLLAQGYNRQYDQRGVEKIVQELQNSLGPTQAERDNAQSAVLSQLPTMEEDYNQLNQYLDNALKSGAGYNANPAAQTLPEAPAGTLYNPTIMTYAGNIDLTNRPQHQNADGSISTVRSMSFNDNGKEVLIPTIAQDGTLMNDEQAIDYYRRTGQNLGVYDTVDEANRAAESIHNSEAYRISELPSYNFGVGDARAYETDNRAAISALADAQAADRLRNFDINQWQANETAKLISQGRTPEQIDAAMAAMLPQAQALEQRNKDLDTQDALAMLGNLDLSAGYDPRAYQVIGRLAKSNPELATMLARDVISPRDEYGFNTQIAGQDNSLNNQIKLAKARDQIARDRQIWENNYTVEQLKRMGMNDSQISNYMLGNRGGSNKSSGNRSVIGSPEFEYANKRLGELRDKMDLNGGSLTPDEQNEFNNLSNYTNSVVNQTYGGFGGNVPQYNADSNMNDFITRADMAAANGATNEQILNQLKQSGYNENDNVYKSVAQYLNSRGSAAPVNTPEPQQQSTAEAQPTPASEPPQPLVPMDANGLPHWWNELQNGGVQALGQIAEANRGANGLPWFWRNNG